MTSAPSANAGSTGAPLPTAYHPASVAEAGASRRDWTSSFVNRHGHRRQRLTFASTGSDAAASSRPPRAPQWWKIRLFRGMINDVRRRAPYYWTDWKDAWDYRVVPATVYMYFAKYGTQDPYSLATYPEHLRRR